MDTALVLPATALIAVAVTARAAEWSDTSLSVRYGTAFAEPFDNNADGSRKNIKKGIVALTHASGYQCWQPLLQRRFPRPQPQRPGWRRAGNTGAQQVDLVFRHALDIGKVMGSPIQFGPVRGVGFTAGFDPNTRTDGYASKKRMLVLGATLMFDVPGQLDASRLLFFESRAHPKSRTPR